MWWIDGLVSRRYYWRWLRKTRERRTLTTWWYMTPGWQNSLSTPMFYSPPVGRSNKLSSDAHIWCDLVNGKAIVTHIHNLHSSDGCAAECSRIHYWRSPRALWQSCKTVDSRVSNPLVRIRCWKRLLGALQDPDACRTFSSVFSHQMQTLIPKEHKSPLPTGMM